MDNRKLERIKALCLLVLSDLFKLFDEVDEQEEELIIKIATTLEKNILLPPQIALNFMYLVDNYPPVEFRKLNAKMYKFLEFERSVQDVPCAAIKSNLILSSSSVYQVDVTRGMSAAGGDAGGASKWVGSLYKYYTIYRKIVSRFHVGLTTAIRANRRVVFALFGARDRFIQWPDNPIDNCRFFKDLYGFPKVVGCINGTHIY
ncbi:hypothetical protein TSAR_008348 [Trichomalopsis sarcophagae]|uniref:DDE Tnp4 domain-containing protein n=1 Tax=Trichomalopsis sarcophagae TaxID=543379 RepID=A0A232EQ20_9HYME|nr:hypothetical protein TSAR_008348 [Trichomalopsis sarcophagae]